MNDILSFVCIVFTMHVYVCAPYSLSATGVIWVLQHCKWRRYSPSQLVSAFCFQSRLFTSLSYHLNLHMHTCMNTHIGVWTRAHTRAKLTTDWLWSLKSLLKMRASNFYSTCSHMHTYAHSYFTQYILSEQICIFILMLLVYDADWEVRPSCSVHFVTIKGNSHPGISPAVGYRFCNCYKIVTVNSE